jgi:hypothetical protein
MVAGRLLVEMQRRDVLFAIPVDGRRQQVCHGVGLADRMGEMGELHGH